jgi:cytochrome c biogenesis protein CcdA
MDMSTSDLRRVVLILCLLSLLFMKVGYSAEPVVVEFFFYEPCNTCPTAQEQYETYQHNTELVDKIEQDYGSKVQVTRTWFYTSIETREQYNLTIPEGWNAIVVNREFVITGFADEAFVRDLIEFSWNSTMAHNVTISDAFPSSRNVEAGAIVDINVTVKNEGDYSECFNTSVYYGSEFIATEYVSNLPPNTTMPLVFHWNTEGVPDGNYTLLARVEKAENGTAISNYLRSIGVVEVEKRYELWGLLSILALAFSFGFFETFSPCLIVMLSFILSYTISETTHFRESFSKVMVFGSGFLLAALLLGLAFGLVFLSLPTLTFYLTIGMSILAILFGFNLLGLLKVPVETKPTIQRLAKKHVVTLLGLFSLGFLFYFLDPCIAPIFVSMIPLLFLQDLALILLVFCVGAMIPFVAIGLSAGSISKLARSTYRNRTILRAVSGLILIGYALYLILALIIPR